MKKIYGLTAVLALFGMILTGCASKESAPAAASTSDSAPVIEIPTEPVELIYGVDYILEPVFGDTCYIEDTHVTFYQGAQNNNHAVLFRLLDPASTMFKDFTIKIDYTMGSYDPSRSCQVCIQPSDDKNADYGAQSYPILYNNFEDNAFSISIDLNKILKSTVKKNAVGFRICCNTGTYERYTWQDNWDFTIDSVTLVPPAN